jgi:hypothetical protein
MPTKETHMPTDKAIDLITKLVASGHSATYIANALNLRRIPSPRGKRWAHAAVKRICEQHQLATPAYDPAKIAAAQAAETPVEVDTLTAPKHAAPDPSDNGSHDAAITRYADEMELHRWLVAQAVEDFEQHLDELALWIEHGPQEPDSTGDDEVDNIARKQAEKAWCDQRDEDIELRTMIAGKDDVTAVALIFVWSCERIDHNAAMAHARDKLEAADRTPEREELRKRHEARSKLYRAAEPKRTETLGDLVIKAERAMRARRAAMAQAADDCRALSRLPVLLFDDLSKALEREQGPTGTASKALMKAEKTWRYRHQQSAELGAGATYGSLRHTKATTEDDVEVD